MIAQMPTPDGMPATQVTQVKVDALVDQCHAGALIKLTALTATQVVININLGERTPTATEQAQVECVLREMRDMPTLQFGFIGNEAYPEREK